MSSTNVVRAAETQTPGSSVSTMLAVDRTRLAHERTLMAWIRTAVSLISFGFTIYKFFQYMREQSPPSREGLLGPREFALMMIGIGLIALFFASLQHIREMRKLRREFPFVPYSLAATLAGLILIFGFLALIAVIFRQ